MMISDKIEVDEKILANGGFADVRCGTHMGQLVAVKTIRDDVAALGDPHKIRKVSINRNFSTIWGVVSAALLQQFCGEVVLWSTLSHPNVLKLVGVHGDMRKGQFSTVSEWMAHGNIMQYIKNNHTNRLDLVRDFTSPATHSLKGDNSCRGQLKVWSTSIGRTSCTGT